MEIMAIYKTGNAHLQTTVTNGLCDFSGIHRDNGQDFTVAEYLEFLGSGFVCIPLEDALEQIHDVLEETYIKPWIEIDEDAWDYALEVLPPEKWQTVDGVNLFRMSERQIADISAHYAAVDIGHDNRYFMAYRRTNQKYTDLASEIKEILSDHAH